MGKACMVRRCIVCGSDSDSSLTEYHRVCRECHKKETESRSRPFIETSAQKIARIEKRIYRNFDADYLKKMQKAKEEDDERRRSRQKRIEQRRIEREMARFKDKLPTKPKYDLDTVLDYRNEITAILTDYRCTGVGSCSRSAVSGAAKEIKQVTRIPENLLHDIIAAYASDGFSVADAELLSARIAGNYFKLRNNVPFVSYVKGDPLEEWALIRIVGVNNKFVDTRGVPGFNMVSEIYTGAMAGTYLKSGYSIGAGRRFAQKLGVRKDNLKYMDPKMLTQMLGWGYIVPCSHGTVRVRSMDVSKTQKDKNRYLLEHRIVLDKCPKGLKPEVYSSCLDCPMGYSKKDTSGKYDILGKRTCGFAVRRDNIVDKLEKQGETDG